MLFLRRNAIRRSHATDLGAAHNEVNASFCIAA
jgi:hypothetical protein